MGVFLGSAQPSLTAPPAALDFSSAASRDFASLSPLLKQVFFIGDGLTSTSSVQQFIVPTGTTRLFLGTMDGFGWFNNSGSFNVTVNGPGAETTPVPLPAGFLLLLTGLAGFGVARKRKY
jgi:hypothetical protein